jgi:hypothetical protein
MEAQMLLVLLVLILFFLPLRQQVVGAAALEVGLKD